MNKISFSTFSGLIGTLSGFFLITFYEYKFLFVIFFINLLISILLLFYINIEKTRFNNREISKIRDFLISILNSKKKIVIFCVFILFLFMLVTNLFYYSEKRSFVKSIARQNSTQMMILFEEFISTSYKLRADAYSYIKKQDNNIFGVNKFKKIYNIEYLTKDKIKNLYNDNRSGLDLKLFKSLINENESINTLSVNEGKVLFNIISGGISSQGAYEYINFVYDLTPFCKKLKKVFDYELVFNSSLNRSSLITGKFFNSEDLLNKIEKSESDFFIKKYYNKKFIITSGEFSKKLFSIPPKIYFIKEIKKEYPGSRYLFIKIFLCTSICILSIIFLYGYTDKMNKVVWDAVTEKDEYLLLSNEKDRSITAVLDAIDDGIIITDISGFINSANMSCEKMSRLLAKDIIDKNIKDIFVLNTVFLPGFIIDNNDFFDDLLKSRKAVFDGKLKNSDGEDINFSINSAVISSEYNEPIGFVFVLNPVLLNKNLKENISFIGYEALEKTGTGFWRWDLEKGDILFSNAWKRLVGIPKSNENNIEEIFLRIHPNEKERVLVDLYEHINEETNFYYSEHRLKRDDGSFVLVCERGKVIKRKNLGKSDVFICTTSGINLKRDEEMFE